MLRSNTVFNYISWVHSKKYQKQLCGYFGLKLFTVLHELLIGKTNFNLELSGAKEKRLMRSAFLKG